VRGLEHRRERGSDRLRRGEQQRDGVPLAGEREGSGGRRERDLGFVGRGRRPGLRGLRLTVRLAHPGEHQAGGPREIIRLGGIVPDRQPGQRGQRRSSTGVGA
jgi:hypothetical protein